MIVLRVLGRVAMWTGLAIVFVLAAVLRGVLLAGRR